MGNFPSNILKSSCNEKLSICHNENRLLKDQLKSLKNELEGWQKGEIVAAGGMRKKTNKKKRKGATTRHK